MLGVYLPQHWIKGVLQAIQAGEDDTLIAYWGRHPGLVTHHYKTEEGPLPVYRLLMSAGRNDAFLHWLEYYSHYNGEAGITGGVYHGLVYLHRPETLKADNAAIESLVNHGLLPIGTDREGYSPLMRAVMQGYYDLAECLLPYSEIHALDKAGNTALHHLAKAEPSAARERCLVKLLSLGGDNHRPNQAGETPRALLAASTWEGGFRAI